MFLLLLTGVKPAGAVWIVVGIEKTIRSAWVVFVFLFSSVIASRLANRVQLATDGHKRYQLTDGVHPFGIASDRRFV